jgi:hypothetical protein
VATKTKRCRNTLVGWRRRGLDHGPQYGGKVDQLGVRPHMPAAPTARRGFLIGLSGYNQVG